MSCNPGPACACWLELLPLNCSLGPPRRVVGLVSTGRAPEVFPTAADYDLVFPEQRSDFPCDVVVPDCKPGHRPVLVG